MSFQNFRLACIAALAVTLIPPSLGYAADPAADATAPAAPATPASHPDGWRSARFGMTEQQLRAVITKDFGIPADKIRSIEEPTQKVQILQIPATDQQLIARGGKGEVSYILGYKSKKLTQISVRWSVALDSQITADTLIGNANLLRDNFMSSGIYKADSIVQNGTLGNNAVVWFKGTDDQGRTTLLLVAGNVQEDKSSKDQKKLLPIEMTLSYFADFANPDIYRLPPGQF